MASTKAEFARRVRTLREGTGLSQEHFADRAGVSRGHMGKLENGKGNPQLDTIVKVARQLEISLSELFAPLNARPEWPDSERRANRTKPK